MIGKNVGIGSGSAESIDILLLRFGDSPSVRINNYYLEPVPDELKLDDSRYESKKTLLPDSSWSLDPRQIRTSREYVDENAAQAGWDFCYTNLDGDQFEEFSESFLEHDLDYWTDREWVSHQQEYF